MSGFSQSERVLIGRLLGTPPEACDPVLVEQVIDIAAAQLRGPDAIPASVVLAAAFESRWHRSGDPEDWNAAVGGYELLIRYPETQLAARGSLAKLLGLRYTREENKDLSLLRLTINMLAELIDDTPPGTAPYAGRALNLGSFLCAGVRDHLDEEIFDYANTEFRDVVANVPLADSHQAYLIFQLADMLLIAYRQGWLDDDTEALDLLDGAASQITGGRERLKVVRRAGFASLHRVQVRLDRDRLQRALGYLSEAMSLDPDPWLRLGFATALSMRAELDVSEADLRRAAAVLAELLPDLAVGSEERLAALIHLGDLRSQLADRNHDEQALNEAIELLTEAVEVAAQGDDQQAITVSRMNLGVALGVRARSGSSEDLDEAIESLVLAQQSAPDRRTEALAATRLGSALLVRHSALGTGPDLTRAVRVLESAVAAQLPDRQVSFSLRRDLAVARARLAEAGQAAPEAVAESLRRLRELRAEVEVHGHRDESVRAALAEVLAIEYRREPDDLVLAEFVELTQGSRPMDSAPSGVPATAEQALSAGSADLDGYLSTGREHRLDQAIDVLRAGTSGPASPNVAAGLYDVLGKAMQHRFRLTFERSDLDEALAANRRSVGFDDPDETLTAVRLVNLANGLRLCFEAYGDEPALAEAAEMGRRAVRMLPAGHPERSRALSSLGHTLSLGTATAPNTDELVDVRRSALAECAPGDARRPMYTVQLAHALMARFRVRRADGDLNEVAQLVERMQEAPDFEGTAQIALYSGDLLLLLLRHRFDDTTLDRATALLRSVTASVPNGLPTQISAFQTLAELSRLRFEHHRDVADLGHTIRLGETLLDVMAPNHRARPDVTADLGWTLVLRARQTNTAVDLDAGLRLIEAALSSMPGDHDARADTLLRLSNARRFRYESGWGDGQDLALAIQAISEAWELPMTRAAHIRALTALCALRLLHFQLLGDPTDLDGAVDSGRTAQELLTGDPEAAEDEVGAALGLAQALRERFQHRGSARDAEDAIAAIKQADATADRDSLRAAARTAGGLTWQARYERTGQLEDLERAIHELRAALELSTAGSPERATIQQHLGIALHVQFQNTTEPENLDDAITALRAATASTAASSPARSRALANLGIALRTRFGHDRQTKDLQDAVAVHEAAVEAVTNDSDRRLALTNLASTLRTRAYHTADLDADDLRAAVDKLRTASALEPLEHPMRSTTLYTLGDTLRLLAPTDGPTLLEEAADRLREASSLVAAPPQDRVRAARGWADAAHVLGDFEQSTRGFRVAVELLPRMAWHGLTRRSRETQLARVSGLAPEAAAAATLVQRDHEAVELLEAGRSVLWTQALTFSADLQALAGLAPELEKRLRELSRELSVGEATDLHA